MFNYKAIPGHPNYFVNENGIVVNKYGAYMRVSEDFYGYMYAYLDGEKVYIHQIVANLYLKKPFDCCQRYVIHKDNDILHNHYTNLAFSSKPEEAEFFEDRKKYARLDKLGVAGKVHNKYRVYNEETGDSIICENRIAVADLIQYELISLKNMVGNGRIIAIGPYAGYKIDRIK